MAKIDKEHYELCKSIAYKAHEGQKRKFTGKPYITHPQAVADMFPDTDSEIDILDRCVAILHDVLEDTFLNIDDLIEKGVDKQVYEQVINLTKRKSDSYYEYIGRLLFSWNACRARKIKIADLKHNLSNLKQGHQRDKYELALLLLERR